MLRTIGTRLYCILYIQEYGSIKPFCITVYMTALYYMLMSRRNAVDESLKVKTTWLLPKSLVRQLKQYALDNDSTVTAVIVEACTEFLTRKRK